MVAMKPLRVCVVLMALVACGEASPPAARIDFSDYFAPLPGDVVGLDAGGDAVWDVAEDAAVDAAPEAGPIVACTPGTLACDFDELVVCNEKGSAWELVDDCDDDNDCTDDTCLDAACVHEPVDENCCHPPCGLGELCLNSECTCTPACFGKECGDDGCGGWCGVCPEGTACSPAGKCNCKPVCDGKECGDDGCGGSCGSCIGQGECVEGQCICEPDCTGKVCGGDGCGGTCGECPALHKCQEGACQFHCPTCPATEGCAVYPFNGHAYYVCVPSLDWGDARDFCTDKQMFLVTINSAEENEFLTQKGGGGSYWIGLYQEWYGWEWRWVSGESFDFKHWDDDQPDNGGFWPPEEDCAELKGSGKWNDNECSSERPFMCEYVPPS